MNKKALALEAQIKNLVEELNNERENYDVYRRFLTTDEEDYRKYHVEELRNSFRSIPEVKTKIEELRKAVEALYLCVPDPNEVEVLSNLWYCGMIGFYII